MLGCRQAATIAAAPVASTVCSNQNVIQRFVMHRGQCKRAFRVDHTRVSFKTEADVCKG